MSDALLRNMAEFVAACNRQSERGAEFLTPKEFLAQIKRVRRKLQLEDEIKGVRS